MTCSIQVLAARMDEQHNTKYDTPLQDLLFLIVTIRLFFKEDLATRKSLYPILDALHQIINFINTIHHCIRIDMLRKVISQYD